MLKSQLKQHSYLQTVQVVCHVTMASCHMTFLTEIQAETVCTLTLCLHSSRWKPVRTGSQSDDDQLLLRFNEPVRKSHCSVLTSYSFVGPWTPLCFGCGGSSGFWFVFTRWQICKHHVCLRGALQSLMTHQTLTSIQFNSSGTKPAAKLQRWKVKSADWF